MNKNSRATINFTALCFIAAFLTSCMGGTLSNHQDIEMLPLRAASESEGKDLKRCLKSASHAQQIRRQKTGKFTRSVKALSLDSSCGDFKMAQSSTPTGFEIRAELNDDDARVRWSVNERGVIEEHLDPENEPYLEF